MSNSLTEKTAILSPCGEYRYLLTRAWNWEQPILPFIMLNPSIADDRIDDPTIRRCMRFARGPSVGGIAVGNLYGLRSTSPAAIKIARDPVGPDNALALRDIVVGAVAQSVPIVCAWGALAPRAASQPFLDIARQHGARLVCLGKTANGSPRHPLYIRADQPFEAFQ